MASKANAKPGKGSSATPATKKRKKEDEEEKKEQGKVRPMLDECKEESHCSSCGWPGHRKTTCKRFHENKQEEIKELQRRYASQSTQLNQLLLANTSSDRDRVFETGQKAWQDWRQREEEALTIRRGHLEGEARRWEAQRESEWRHEKELLQRQLEEARREREQLRQSLLEAQNRIIHLQARVGGL